MARKERQIQGLILQLLRDTIKENNLEDYFEPYIIQEEDFGDIWIRDKKGKPICFIELKDPESPDGKTVYNYKVFMREFNRAKKHNIELFGILNLREAVLYNLVCPEKKCDYPIAEKILDISEIRKLKRTLILDENTEKKFKKFLSRLLSLVKELYEGRIPPLKPIDERFVIKVRSFINAYIYDITDEVWREYQKNNSFKKELNNWVKKQLWNIPTNEEDILRITRIALLLLISKLIFYKALYDEKIYRDLPKLVIPENKSAREIYEYLWHEYFEYVKELIDFETIIGDKDEIISKLPFVSEGITDFLKAFVEEEDNYNFKELPYDIVGRIFEGLISEEERHKLGQYFTPSLVVDLINSFCIREGDEKVLDPSCGSGTFLVRSYHRKKDLKNKRHSELLNELYGIDISTYAVHLASLNLAVKDLRFIAYPRVICKDFFSVKLQQKEKIKDIDFVLGDFDAIVGNPPYTRQEEMEDFFEGMKDKAWNLVKGEWKLEVSKRSSIYAYFFYHAGMFLKEGGYFGYITSNSWLDVDYGKDLQKWMLDNFKIIAIIDSKVERFFPDADVNTAITILQKESNKKERNNNLVKFVYLKKKLQELLEKSGNFDNLRKFIEKTNQLYEDEYLKITPIVQKELYKDNKWGKYLRAPDVFWEILRKSPDAWIELGKVAKVRRGFTTGANEFFYVKDLTDSIEEDALMVVKNNNGLRSLRDIKERKLRVVENKNGELWFLEKEYVKPLVKSLREVESIVVQKDQLKHCVIILPNRSKNELKPFVRKLISDFEYRRDKEGNLFIDRPTLQSRKFWYSLPHIDKADFFVSMMYGDRWLIPYNKDRVYDDHNLFGIILKDSNLRDEFVYSLNNTFLMLYHALHGYQLTGNITVAKMDGHEIEKLLIVNPNKIKTNEEIIASLSSRKINSIFEELGANSPEDVSLKKVKVDRLELDRAVLEAVGFTEPKERDEILLELYKAVIDLIRSRLEKAKSVQKTDRKTKKIEITFYVQELKKLLQEEKINPKNTFKFAMLLKEKVKEITSDRKLQNKIVNSFWIEFFGEKLDLKQLKLKEQTRLSKWII